MPTRMMSPTSAPYRPNRTVTEIGSVERIVQCITAVLGVGPFAEFLSEPAVIGVGSPSVFQALSIHQPLHAVVGCIEIDIPARSYTRKLVTR